MKWRTRQFGWRTATAGVAAARAAPLVPAGFDLGLAEYRVDARPELVHVAALLHDLASSLLWQWTC